MSDLEKSRRCPSSKLLRDRPYQAGRSKHWVKIKNRQHPAMERVMDMRTTSLACRRRLAANSFEFGRALRRGVAFCGVALVLRRGLRIADRLGQDRM
jgi:hypothetical protein